MVKGRTPLLSLWAGWINHCGEDSCRVWCSIHTWWTQILRGGWPHSHPRKLLQEIHPPEQDSASSPLMAVMPNHSWIDPAQLCPLFPAGDKIPGNTSNSFGGFSFIPMEDAAWAELNWKWFFPPRKVQHYKNPIWWDRDVFCFFFSSPSASQAGSQREWELHSHSSVSPAGYNSLSLSECEFPNSSL